MDFQIYMASLLLKVFTLVLMLDDWLVLRFVFQTLPPLNNLIIFAGS